jgi:poly-gamma-glutamate synthesis protein (capsule biosynthesis protein)
VTSDVLDDIRRRNDEQCVFPTTPHPARVAASATSWQVESMRHASFIILSALLVAAGCTSKDATPAVLGSQLTGPPAPRHLAADKKDVTLFFAGDTSVARGVADTIDGPGKGDAGWVFEHTRELFARADLTFLNLECVLADTDAGEAKKTWRIRAPKKYGAGLKALGVDVVSVANNHALDFAEPGFRSTLQELDTLGIMATGVQYAQEPKQEPTVVTVGTLKVGFLAYNAHGDEHKDIEYRPRSFGYKRAAVLADILRVRPTVDVLAVSIHWGPELAHWPWDWQVQDAHAYVDAGADLILGHHPHVVQPFEQYKDALIVYSFGDFIFDKSSPWLVDRTNARYGLRLSYSGKTRTGFDIVPMWPDKDRRPMLRSDIDTTSWQLLPRPAVWRASEVLDKATVTRAGLPVEACSWKTTRPIARSGYLRWLSPRLACDDDEKRPWMTVAPTAEFAAGTLRRGIWAPPHDQQAPLRLVFPAVPLSARLVGFVGIPDWWARQSGAGRQTRLAVSVAGDAAPRFVVEVTPGVSLWRDISVNTADRQGTRADVIVDIVGGAAPREGSFVFDLETAAAP